MTVRCLFGVSAFLLLVPAFYAGEAGLGWVCSNGLVVGGGEDGHVHENLVGAGVSASREGMDQVDQSIRRSRVSTSPHRRPSSFGLRTRPSGETLTLFGAVASSIAAAVVLSSNFRSERTANRETDIRPLVEKEQPGLSRSGFFLGSVSVAFLIVLLTISSIAASSATERDQLRSASSARTANSAASSTDRTSSNDEAQTVAAPSELPRLAVQDSGLVSAPGLRNGRPGQGRVGGNSGEEIEFQYPDLKDVSLRITVKSERDGNNKMIVKTPLGAPYDLGRESVPCTRRGGGWELATRGLVSGSSPANVPWIQRQVQLFGKGSQASAQLVEFVDEREGSPTQGEKVMAALPMDGGGTPPPASDLAWWDLSDEVFKFYLGPKKTITEKVVLKSTGSEPAFDRVPLKEAVPGRETVPPGGHPKWHSSASYPWLARQVQFFGNGGDPRAVLVEVEDQREDSPTKGQTILAAFPEDYKVQQPPEGLSEMALYDQAFSYYCNGGCKKISSTIVLSTSSVMQVEMADEPAEKETLPWGGHVKGEWPPSTDDAWVQQQVKSFGKGNSPDTKLFVLIDNRRDGSHAGRRQRRIVAALPEDMHPPTEYKSWGMLFDEAFAYYGGKAPIHPRKKIAGSELTQYDITIYPQESFKVTHERYYEWLAPTRPRSGRTWRPGRVLDRTSAWARLHAACLTSTKSCKEKIFVRITDAVTTRHYVVGMSNFYLRLLGWGHPNDWKAFYAYVRKFAEGQVKLPLP